MPRRGRTSEKKILVEVFVCENVSAFFHPTPLEGARARGAVRSVVLFPEKYAFFREIIFQWYGGARGAGRAGVALHLRPRAALVPGAGLVQVRGLEIGQSARKALLALLKIGGLVLSCIEDSFCK